jgi:hypothetical protein
MNQKHFVTKLKANSPYVGRNCPVRQTPLQSGDMVVVCQQRDVAVVLDSWRAMEGAWGEKCPYCGEAVALSELLSDVLPSPKPPPSAPVYPPARPEGGSGLKVKAAGIAALILVCIGVTLGTIISSALFRKATPTPTAISFNSTYTPTPSRTTIPSNTPSVLSASNAPSPSETSTPTRTPTVTFTPISLEAEAEEIQQVIWAFDSIKKDAVGASYDDSQLTTVLRGQALEEQRGSVTWLRTCNAYYEITLHGLTIESFGFSSPTYATVIVRKDESRVFYQMGQNPESTPHDIYRISYDVQNFGGRWYITRKGVIDERTGFTPTPRPTASEITCR